MSGRRGFTLMELLMAVFISSLIFGGMAAITATATRTQGREYRHGVVGQNALFTLRVVEVNVSQATQLITPALGGTGSALCVARCTTNCTDAWSTPTYDLTYICRGVDSKVYLYSRSQSCSLITGCVSSNCPSPSGGCGGGTDWTLVADAIGTLTFSRSGDYANEVTTAVTGSMTSVATGTTEEVKTSATSVALQAKAQP